MGYCEFDVKEIAKRLKEVGISLYTDDGKIKPFEILMREMSSVFNDN